MHDLYLGEPQQTDKSSLPASHSVNDILKSGERIVERAVCANPVVALAISAAIGVLLGCLIKRR